LARQFSEKEVEEFGAVLLYRFLTEEKSDGKFKELPISETVRLVFVDWLQQKKEFDDDPPNPITVQIC
jgi:hypothetical protein